MSAFHSEVNPQSGLMVIKLAQTFLEEDWSELIKFYKDKVHKGKLSWELDLSSMPFITSNSIGMIIALNTSIMANEGILQVVMDEKSHVASQIRFARIDKIVKMIFV